MIVGWLEVFAGVVAGCCGGLLVGASITEVRAGAWRVARDGRERLIVVCTLLATTTIGLAGVLLFLEGIARITD